MPIPSYKFKVWDPNGIQLSDRASSDTLLCFKDFSPNLFNYWPPLLNIFIASLVTNVFTNLRILSDGSLIFMRFFTPLFVIGSEWMNICLRERVFIKLNSFGKLSPNEQLMVINILIIQFSFWMIEKNLELKEPLMKNNFPNVYTFDTNFRNLMFTSVVLKFIRTIYLSYGYAQ